MLTTIKQCHSEDPVLREFELFRLYFPLFCWYFLFCFCKRIFCKVQNYVYFRTFFVSINSVFSPGLFRITGHYSLITEGVVAITPENFAVKNVCAKTALAYRRHCSCYNSSSERPRWLRSAVSQVSTLCPILLQTP